MQSTGGADKSLVPFGDKGSTQTSTRVFLPQTVPDLFPSERRSRDFSHYFERYVVCSFRMHGHLAHSLPEAALSRTLRPEDKRSHTVCLKSCGPAKSKDVARILENVGLRLQGKSPFRYRGLRLGSAKQSCTVCPKRPCFSIWADST